ncbi:Mce-associated membrane protein [Stackebrandtia endophytica]|uniref:Mce-associated membrane protein n=1 Tax=Stackebrandtia endophytica TaxID=1496996 RepID=A0A543AZN9_9ACTN|nr:hypothetical protein [Stackebrandtia endophytica]TQL78055.1 Mce-associated membrane protein [Stackebrandtia endophytica]
MSGYVPKKLRRRGASKPPQPQPNSKGKTKGKSTKRPSGATVPRQRRGDHDNRPRPTGRRPSPVPRGKPRRNAAHLRRIATRLAILLVAVVLLGVGTYFGSTTINSTTDAKAAVQAAKTAAAALFSYDYRDFDASVANGLAHATGVFAEEYEVTTQGLRESVEAEKARIVADVVDVALLNATVTYTDAEGTEYPGAVEVLAFVNHIVTNDDIGTRTDQTRVILTMVNEDGAWLTIHTISL